jgi:hypothetical protein
VEEGGVAETEDAGASSFVEGEVCSETDSGGRTKDSGG